MIEKRPRDSAFEESAPSDHPVTQGEPHLGLCSSYLQLPTDPEEASTSQGPTTTTPKPSLSKNISTFRAIIKSHISIQDNSFLGQWGVYSQEDQIPNRPPNLLEGFFWQWSRNYQELSTKILSKRCLVLWKWSLRPKMSVLRSFRCSSIKYHDRQ